MKNEPGIASNHISSVVSLTTANMVDIATVTITIPSAGYVIVDGTCYTEVNGTTGFNGADFQIDMNQGGSQIAGNHVAAGYSQWPDGLGQIYTVHTSKAYYFAMAGTYTFRLEGMQWNGSAGMATGVYPTLHAIYYPTSYGSVTTAVSASEAGQFENPQAIPVTTGSRLTKTELPETIYQVDLRELEIRALKAQAESEKTQRELAEAQLKMQMEKTGRNSPDSDQ
jgi:hypothetical protein